MENYAFEEAERGGMIATRSGISKGVLRFIKTFK